MPLRLSEVTSLTPAGHVGPENWLEGRTRVFIRSAAFDTVRRDLRRYVDGEINGRSHLIAGHRGAGKTALVLAAIEAVRFDVLTGQPSGQRPLLVKLHGPSLFSGALPSAGQDVGATARAGDATGTDGAATVPASSAGQTDQAAPAAKAPEPDDRLRAALAQITVALYRAVASEVAEAFRTQVLQASGNPPDARLLELAAQLNLELDNGSTAGVLRGFWNKLGRLMPGVLWPHDWPAVRADQGMREIVAVATASQAFQVCIGAIDYKTKTNNADSSNQTTKTGVQLDAGPALKRLAGLLGGAALGGALAAGGADGKTAAVAGLAAGMIGATFAISGTRTRDRSQSASYEFIRDTSVTTLDRDLPEVIERLRRAGLRPVFLVDELDKLGDPTAARNAAQGAADAPDRLRDLVDRLKNLTTDYGFFCFLTNRDYYEALRDKLQASVYPREHTYFSHMHYVLCSSADQLRYVLQVVACTLSDTDKEAPLHWMALAFTARLRSRMNVISLVRELNRHVDGTGALRPQLRALGQRPTYRLATAMQMVIDLKLAEPEVQARIEEDPIFGQLVADALYRLPVALDAGEASVSLTEPDLTTYLRARSGNCRQGGAAIDQFSAGDRSWLAALAAEAARALTSFAALGALAERYWTPETREAVLPAGGADPIEAQAIGLFASLMPAPSPTAGLVREDQPLRFTFLLDKFCVPVQQAPASLAAHPRAPRQLAFAEAAGDLVGARGKPSVLAKFQLDVSYLKELGVLSASVPDETSIRQVLDAPGTAALASDGTAVVEAFFEAVVQASSLIAWAALLTRSIGTAAQSMATIRQDVALTPYSEAALRAGIARHIRYRGTLGPDDPLNLAEALRASSINLPADGVAQARLFEQTLPRIVRLDGEAVQQWAKEIEALPELIVDEITLTQDPWTYWRSQTARLFEGGDTPPITLSQLVLSVRGVRPACLFRWDLTSMSILEWSEIARACYAPWTSSGQLNPRWAVVAALRQLGFEPTTVNQALSGATLYGSSVQDDVANRQFLSSWTAPPNARILYVIESSGHTVANEVPPAGVASFAVRRAELSDAATLLDILNQGGQMSVNVV